MEVIRLDEEPVSKTGGGKTLASSSLAASAMFDVRLRNIRP